MIENRKTILIADDDADLLLITKIQLQKAGFLVRLSPNARGITELVHKDKPDIILLDVSMDGISGEDVCRKLKTDASTADIPVIIFSANDDIEKVTTACGANAFVRKPFNSRTMQDAIRRYI